MSDYLIIGNSIAGIGCIEGIRSVDKTGTITVISGENHAAYGRPLISYFLEGKTDLDHMNYRSPDFYENMGVDVIYGKKAEKLDPEKGEILLDSGETIPFGKVCVSTGSSPFVPPFEGLDTVESKFSFMTLDDALAIDAVADESKRVLIVGAGLIGLKCAEGLKNRVKEITVCDLAERVLSSILDTECAALMQKHLEENGIKFLLGDSAVSFDRDKAVMKSGKTVEFDILILAVGVRPNTSLVADAGGEVNRGIIVDGRMATTLKNVYAAGDCTEGEDISLGQKRVLAILPNAYMQGHAAGVSMAGGEESFNNAIPMNSIGFFGFHAMTAGTYEGDLYEDKTEDSIKRLFTKDDLLKGFIIIGKEERAGIYTSLIREKTPLSSLNFEILKQSATTAAFSPDLRRKKFGGMV